MPNPAAPDPAQIQRGSVALTTALQISTLLLGEQDALFSILRSLNTANELLPRLVGQPGSETYPARLLFAIVDNYRRPRPLHQRTGAGFLRQSRRARPLSEN